ncbi:hypothetical protein ACFL08_00255 [Patescibacteria group bacterium]
MDEITREISLRKGAIRDEKGNISDHEKRIALLQEECSHPREDLEIDQRSNTYANMHAFCKRCLSTRLLSRRQWCVECLSGVNDEGDSVYFCEQCKTRYKVDDRTKTASIIKK